jgi:hypothetical protein
MPECTSRLARCRRAAMAPAGERMAAAADLASLTHLRRRIARFRSVLRVLPTNHKLCHDELPVDNCHPLTINPLHSWYVHPAGGLMLIIEIYWAHNTPGDIGASRDQSTRCQGIDVLRGQSTRAQFTPDLMHESLKFQRDKDQIHDVLRNLKGGNGAAVPGQAVGFRPSC